MIIKSTRCDKDFIRNMPPKLLSAIIFLEDVIPDDLQSALIRNNEFYHEERRQFEYRRPEIQKKIHEIRAEKYQLSIYEYVNYEHEEDIEFIKKYPQFKPIIDHIEFRNTDDIHTIIETIPIDEYLAEN